MNRATRFLLCCLVVVAVSAQDSADFREAEVEAIEHDPSLPQADEAIEEVADQLKTLPSTEEEEEKDDALESGEDSDSEDVNVDDELEAMLHEQKNAAEDVAETEAADNKQSPVADLSKYFSGSRKNTAMTCEAKLIEYKKDLDKLDRTRNAELRQLKVVLARVKDLTSVQDEDTSLLDVNDEQAMQETLLSNLEMDRPHKEVVGPGGIVAMIKQLENKINADARAHKKAYKGAVSHCLSECRKLLKYRRSVRDRAVKKRHAARRHLDRMVKHLELNSGKLQVATKEVARAQKHFDSQEAMRAKELKLIEALFGKIVELRGIKAVTAQQTEDLELTKEEASAVAALIPDENGATFMDVTMTLGRDHANVRKVSSLLTYIKRKIHKEHDDELKALNKLKAIKARLEKVVAYYTKAVAAAKAQLELRKREERHAKAHLAADTRRCARISTIAIGKVLPAAASPHRCANVLANSRFTAGVAPWRANQNVAVKIKGLYLEVKNEQDKSTPGIRQDGIRLIPGMKYRIAVSGYVQSKGYACPWVGTHAGKDLLWGCNSRKSLPRKDGDAIGTFVATKDKNETYRIGVLFSAAAKGDYFAVRRVTVCALPKPKKSARKELQDEIEEASDLTEDESM